MVMTRGCAGRQGLAGVTGATRQVWPAPGVEPLELRIAVVSDGRAAYFIRLLEESLKLIRQPYHIQYV
ncbi:MAG TPA: hypothetical protein VN089_18450, partial [Duganella sp.]|nr:hypothetical protein [Duganella sp.]